MSHAMTDRSHKNEFWDSTASQYLFKFNQINKKASFMRSHVTSTYLDRAHVDYISIILTIL